MWKAAPDVNQGSSVFYVATPMRATSRYAAMIYFMAR